ncbi:MAG TPA: zinc ribbon domain-containing protein [Solirubrobacterales bacterium]|nr:zinc ribbon domain-containing protein [Solirubrobacterales bacterium]
MTTPATEVHTAVAGDGDNCPNCGTPLARDQRYCLHCGQRRGDPRLPFMDAVVFMETSKRRPVEQTAAPASPPPPERQPFISANASLVAGVATLVLAIGVGVLIGRSGDSGATNAAAPAPQIIRVGGGGGEVASTAGSGGTDKVAGKAAGTAGKPKSATQKKAQKKAATGDSGTTKAVEEVYEPAAGVKIAPPEQKIGGECDPSTAGCGDSGKFEGTFFE